MYIYVKKKKDMCTYVYCKSTNTTTTKASMVHLISKK